jgi:hypothetical protein
MSFKPKRIVEPEDGAPPRPSSAELAAALAPAVTNLIPTAPPAPKLPPLAAPPVALAPETPAPASVPVAASVPTAPPARTPAEPVLMMSFKASKPFAKMLAEAAEKEGGLRRLVARVFHEAGYPVPPSELQPQKRRRTYD